MNEANFVIETLQLTPDKEGENTATLLAYAPAVSHTKAVLYIHGFIDYFFHEHVAEFFHQQDYAFYAIDLRRYGRSILPHQRPNHSHNITEYYEELSIAVERIKEKHSYLVLFGHSTGGLTAPLFVAEADAGKHVDALLLNSPFFDLNYPSFLKKTVLPLLLKLGKSKPYTNIYAKISSLYGMSLHKDFKGEWDFDLSYKPIKGFSITAGWVVAIHEAQQRLQSGLNLHIPTLVIHSAKSINRMFRYCPQMAEADAVLNVQAMRKYASCVTDQLTRVEINGALHDVYLSKEEVRNKAFTETANWLQPLDS